MNTIWNWLVARINEPSTWAGISAGAIAVGGILASKGTLEAAIVPAIVAIFKAETGSTT